MDPYEALIDQINELRNTDKVLMSVLSTVIAEQKERIFDQGLAVDGTKIGSYSTKKIRIPFEKQARKTRSEVFQGGYKEYKQAIGFDSGKVNLVETGQMMSDYSIIRISENYFGLGFKNELNTKKAQGNEARFGKEIFAQSENEDRVLDAAFEVELKRIFG